MYTSAFTASPGDGGGGKGGFGSPSGQVLRRGTRGGDGEEQPVLLSEKLCGPELIKCFITY